MIVENLASYNLAAQFFKGKRKTNRYVLLLLLFFIFLFCPVLDFTKIVICFE